MKRLGTLSIMLFLGAGACTPFVPVVSVSDLPQAERTAAANVRVFSVGQNAPRVQTALGRIEAYSCKFLPWSAPASRDDALEQLQVKAVQMQANAIINLTFDGRGADIGTNCYETVHASGTAVRIQD